MWKPQNISMEFMWVQLILLCKYFVGQTSTYVLVEQVWTYNGIEIYSNGELITLSPNVEAFLSYYYNDGHVAVGILTVLGEAFNVYFPTLYSFGPTTYSVINTGGFTEPSGRNRLSR